MSITKNHFADAKAILKAALAGDGDSITLNRAQIEALYKSRPEQRRLRRSWAVFDAEYLRFLLLPCSRNMADCTSRI
mgnify:CR=1 FL=1